MSNIETTSWALVRAELIEFTRRRVADRDTAEDIVHDVFERFQRVDQAGIHNTQAWLYRSVRNAIIDHYRTRRVTEELPAELPAFEDESGEPEEVIREFARCLRPLIEDLPDKYQNALRLVDIEGNTHNAAAQVEGISVSGMKSRVQRGRHQLGNMLTTCCSTTTAARENCGNETTALAPGPTGNTERAPSSASR